MKIKFNSQSYVKVQMTNRILITFGQLKRLKLKFFAFIVCFYINILAVIPTVRVINMTMEQKCHDTCCGKHSDKEVPNSCQKEKALVNLNFNSGPFLVFNTDYEFEKVFLDYSSAEKTSYNNSLFPSYSGLIWQPPEYATT